MLASGLHMCLDVQVRVHVHDTEMKKGLTSKTLV